MYPQLYKVVQDHTSQADWTPDATSALYTAIGLDDSGYPVWSQPTGAHDAYNAGDVVNFSGTLRCVLDERPEPAAPAQPVNPAPAAAAGKAVKK